MIKHPIYNSWSGMKSRCLNPNHPAYCNYGGRGISVCDRWMQFENFRDDMLLTWKPGLTLDRFPNNNGNYDPRNCRWATRKEQRINQSPRPATSEATKIKMSISRKGNQNALGHKRSDATKAKQSAKMMGRKQSDATKAKKSASMKAYCAKRKVSKCK